MTTALATPFGTLSAQVNVHSATRASERNRTVITCDTLRPLAVVEPSGISQAPNVKPASYDRAREAAFCWCTAASTPAYCTLVLTIAVVSLLLLLKCPDRKLADGTAKMALLGSNVRLPTRTAAFRSQQPKPAVSRPSLNSSMYGSSFTSLSNTLAMPSSGSRTANRRVVTMAAKGADTLI